MDENNDEQSQRYELEINQRKKSIDSHSFTDEVAVRIDKFHTRLETLRIKHQATKQSYEPHLKGF